jgi:hypothetical protein
LIEIIKYLDRSYQKRIYNDILKIEKSDLITFLIDFMEIDKKYNDLSSYHLVKVNKGGEIINALNSSIFYIKERLSKRYQKIDELTDNEFELFENVSKISKIMKTKKVSNKVYKWLEILSLCCSSDKNYTVFSNGYMPKMFLEAMKCYLSIHYDDFKWHSNTNDDIDNIPMEKCVNALDIETSDIENITYIENKLKRKIDIYSTYSNKDDDSIKRFIGDILFGLVTLKENGIMLFNMKSFFTPIQVSIIGIIMDMFEVRIVKPYFSSITESEVYFICENYKRDDSKIKILRDLLMVDSKDYYYIPNSMDMNKYSSLLLAAYTYYGRQIYFMDMDMHLYETYKSYGVKDKDDIKSMKDVKDKFISYYTQKRLEWNKELKKIKDTFTIRKWNNHKCKKNVKKDKQKIKRWGSLSSNAPSFSKNIDSYIGLK